MRFSAGCWWERSFEGEPGGRATAKAKANAEILRCAQNDNQLLNCGKRLLKFEREMQ
jgi:hypothetical protein